MPGRREGTSEDGHCDGAEGSQGDGGNALPSGAEAQNLSDEDAAADGRERLMGAVRLPTAKQLAG